MSNYCITTTIMHSVQIIKNYYSVFVTNALILNFVTNLYKIEFT